MCGIYGMVGPPDRPLRHPECLPTMGDRLRHRGPDGSRRIVEYAWALGAERLRIVDQSERADQPLRSADGTAWLVANGEVYNAPELADEYRDYRFRSRTDVEVFHPLLAHHGRRGLSAVRGMFAIARWDSHRSELLLARDPAGEKPLFLAEVEGEVWFASEIQALLAHPTLDRRTDEQAITAYLALGYFPEPRTPFRGIRKLPAGCAALWSPGTGLRVSAYEEAPAAGDPCSTSAPPSTIRHHLTRATELQLRSDVPVGVFVSGGLDSALVTALAAGRQPRGALSTFTVRFSEPSYDEGAFGRRLAHDLNTDHHETLADWDSLEEALHALIRGTAEPLADPAWLPTWLLARDARQRVGVVLSGEGADELFGGYPTYLGHRWARAASTLPTAFRAAMRRASSGPAASAARVPVAYLVSRFLEHAHEDWATRHLSWFGTGLFTHMDRRVRQSLIDALGPGSPGQDVVRAAMDLDYRTYLRDGLLVKLDRATMAHGLEARAPYLDREVVASSRACSGHELVGRLRTKRVLHTVAEQMIPRWVGRRRKRGLSVPIAAWINGGLSNTVDRVLGAEALHAGPSGVLSGLPIAQLLTEHREGRRNNARALWALIVLQLWHEHWILGN